MIFYVRTAKNRRDGATVSHSFSMFNGNEKFAKGKKLRKRESRVVIYLLYFIYTPSIINYIKHRRPNNNP